MENNQERQDQLCRLRLKLLENGYEPIPTLGKKPQIFGWQRGLIDQERIVRDTIVHKDHENTGLRTGRLVGVDVDLLDDAHAALICELTFELLGQTLLRRRGSKGMMLLYRQIADPIGKIILAGRDKEGERAKTLVEIFGQGGQFVAYGVHPDTGSPYTWLEPDQEPLVVPWLELPPVTPDHLCRLRERLRNELALLGYTISAQTAATHSGPVPAGGAINDADHITRLFLALLPNDASYGRSGYVNFCCPCCRKRDRRSGFQVLANGGFHYHCFHAGCEFHKTTGWQPPNEIVGARVVRLYEYMGGDPADLRAQKKKHQNLKGYASVEEMQIDLGLKKK